MAHIYIYILRVLKVPHTLRNRHVRPSKEENGSKDSPCGAQTAPSPLNRLLKGYIGVM